MMTIFVIALLVCGVFGDEVKSVSVMEGDSVTLHTDLTGTQRDQIKWWFGPEGSSILLFHIDGSTPEIKNVEGFKDRLQISDIQSGNLIIKNIKKKHAGLYKAVINTATGKIQKLFNVTVNDAPDEMIDTRTGEVKSVSVTVGGFVPLYSNVRLENDALILWRFGPKGTLIAKYDTEDNKTPEYPDALNGSFKSRLQVNNQTGDLTIKDFTYEDSGDYKLKISSNTQIIYKTFSLHIRGAGWSSGAVAGLCVPLVIAVLIVVVGVFWYLCKKQKVTFLPVNEGNPVTLSGDESVLQIGTLIEWKFKGDVIITGEKTEDTKITVTYSDDQQFKDRLKLGSQVGYLTIKDASRKDTGLYEGKITYNKQTLHFKFNVNVIDKTLRGLSDDEPEEEPIDM